MTKEERRAAEKQTKVMLTAAKKAKKSVDRRIDGYLEGTYDPKAEARKITAKGVTTSLVVLSLLTGLAFSSPADITQDQTEAANFRPTPVVLDVDEFVSTPVEEDDEDEDGDEQKSTKLSFTQRFRQTVL